MTTKTGKKVEKFDKFSDRLQGLVSLSDGGTAATFNDFTLGGINDLDGLVITDQPISAGSSFDVVVTEMRVFGNPLTFGFTTLSPMEVRKIDSWKSLEDSREFWYIVRSRFCWEGKELPLPLGVGESLLQLETGDTFGCRVSSTGCLVIRAKNKDICSLNLNLPLNKLQWGWVNIDTRVTSISSRFTTGIVILRYLGRPYISASSLYQGYLCNVCHDLPHEPFAQKCCKRVICRSCAKDNPICQHCSCRVEPQSDIQLEKRILDIRLFCPNAGKGCPYKHSMALRDVSHHLCKFQALLQSDSAGDLTDRKQKLSLENMKSKLRNISSRRRTTHECENIHNRHEDSFVESKLSPGTPVSDQVHDLISYTSGQVVPFDFIITNVSKKESMQTNWQSRHFYSCHHGYKLTVGMNFANDYFNYLTVYLHPGEYDNQLKWPFLATIKCHLLKKDGGVFHSAIRYLTAEDGSKVKEKVTRRLLLYNVFGDDFEAFWQSDRSRMVNKHCVEGDSIKIRVLVGDFTKLI